MKQRTFATIRRVRARVEERRLAEAATAHASLAEARRRRNEAASAAQQSPLPPGPATAAAASLARASGTGLTIQVVSRIQRERDAEHMAQLATDRHRRSARELRTIDRLDERDRARTALLAARRAERQLDDLATQRWLPRPETP